MQGRYTDKMKKDNQDKIRSISNFIDELDMYLNIRSR
jgi:hypothetical protein